MTIFLVITLSSLLTVAIFLGGFWLGFSTGRRVVAGNEKMLKQTHARHREGVRKAPAESGPVKPMTPEEYTAEREQPMRDKMASILGVKKP